MNKNPSIHGSGQKPLYPPEKDEMSQKKFPAQQQPSHSSGQQFAGSQNKQGQNDSFSLHQQAQQASVSRPQQKPGPTQQKIHDFRDTKQPTSSPTTHMPVRSAYQPQEVSYADYLKDTAIKGQSRNKHLKQIDKLVENHLKYPGDPKTLHALMHIPEGVLAGLKNHSERQQLVINKLNMIIGFAKNQRERGVGQGPKKQAKSGSGSGGGSGFSGSRGVNPPYFIYVGESPFDNRGGSGSGGSGGSGS